MVVELGDRVGAAVCGTLLAQLGADVVLVEPNIPAEGDNKWRNRAVVAAGKRSLVAEGHDDEVLIAALEKADVVLLSSDVSPPPEWSRGKRQIVCDITACGASGPLSNRSYSDRLVQALTGVADTTGNSSGLPTVIGFDALEFSAGIYAASAVLVALRARRRSGIGQDIEVALFDCGVTALTSFLPLAIVGKHALRAGNAHSLTAPWNAYNAADGWILICTATDEQWKRLKLMIGFEAPGLDTNLERVSRVQEVDAMVQAWVARLTVKEAQDQLDRIRIPCGPILTVEQVAAQENLIHRGMIGRRVDPLTGRNMLIPGSAFKASLSPGKAAAHIPAPNEDRQYMKAALDGWRRDDAGHESDADSSKPLAGIRVLEIGQFTAAPLAARQLGALGAEVIKIEPPGGEGSRKWGPGQGGLGYFFMFNNNDKDGMVLDLAKNQDRKTLLELLKGADILVENLKPGAIEKFGFDVNFLKKTNPRLIYCAVSGFGRESIYPGRPAFDTVLQAMCGVMDLTRSGGTPMKTGISIADVLGGEYALFAILAALEFRERTGVGQFIDLAMQEVVAWATQMEWGRPARRDGLAIVRCDDGYVAVEGPHDDLASWMKSQEADTGHRNVSLDRKAMMEAAERAGLRSVPVCSVNEVLASPHAIARGVIVQRPDTQGLSWPLLGSPMRLSLTPAEINRPIRVFDELEMIDM